MQNCLQNTNIKAKCPPLIKGVNFTHQDIEKVRSSNQLLTLTYLVSNRCNLRCPYCYTNAGKPLINELTFDESKNVIDQAKEQGAKIVWIPGSGEPFLDTKFYRNGKFPLIDYANKKGLSVTFFTSGYFITKRIAHTLRDKNVSIITKLNSFNPDVQDFLVGSKGAFYKLHDSLKNLIDAGFNKENITRLGINTVITRQNYDEILNIFRFCRDNNIIPYISVTLHGGRANQHLELDVSSDEISNLFQSALKIDQEEYGYTWFPSPPIIADQCKKLFYDIVVTPNGNVQICPGIDICIGNIREKPLKHIMEQSILLHKIRNMKDYLKGKCASCESSDCLYGCRLEALNNGDLFGEDPMCWRDC